jgi:hypothetical protein
MPASTGFTKIYEIRHACKKVSRPALVSTMIYERIDVTKATGKIPVNQRKIHQLIHRVQAQWGVLYVKWFQEKKIVLLVVVRCSLAHLCSSSFEFS